MTDALDHFKRLLLPAVEEEIKSLLVPDAPGTRLYFGMMHYHLGWVDMALRPVEGQFGKRIRPLVCLLVCDTAGGVWDQALPASAAIELLHNFSLIHDDIEDDSPTRRGRDTVWRLWGIPQAINAGDSMFSFAFDALSKLHNRGVSAEAVVETWKVFSQACIQLTKGQHLDMSFESRENVDVEEYLQMIAGKTAALLSAAAEIGAIVAEAAPDGRKHLAEFGRNLGLAFQTYDDFLGVWGDELLTGKSTASDILARKKTLPVLYGLSHSQQLRDLYASPEMSLEQVVDLLEMTGAKDYTLTTAQHYSEAALEHLEKAAPEGPSWEALRLLTVRLIQRQQ